MMQVWRLRIKTTKHDETVTFFSKLAAVRYLNTFLESYPDVDSLLMFSLKKD